MTNKLAELAQHLRDQEPVLIGRWARASNADRKLQSVNRLSRKEFRDDIPEALSDLCSMLEGGFTAAERSKARGHMAAHGQQRWKQGFNLRELLRDWGHLNRVLLATFAEFFESRAAEHWAQHARALDALADFMTEATSTSVRRFDELRQDEAARLSSNLAALKRNFDQLSQARGQLLREAAHDIRGGLSTIATASAVLKDADSDGAPEQDSGRQGNGRIADMLQRSVDSVNEMIGSLLDLSRLEAGAEQLELQSVDVGHLLRELAQEHSPTATERKLEFHFDGPRELPVRTDPEKVRRIAQNLLSNALKYTQSGGISMGWAIEADGWALEVQDTGPGMELSSASDIKSPLPVPLSPPPEPTSEAPPDAPAVTAGEGIGLTIVKKLSDMLGASISVESALGHGTRIRIRFPADYD